MEEKYAILLGFDKGHPALSDGFLQELTAIVAAEIASFETDANWTVNTSKVADTSFHVISGHSSFNQPPG